MVWNVFWLCYSNNSSDCEGHCSSLRLSPALRQCDLLPVNSTIEDMVDTMRQILGRVRLVFEKHHWVFWGPFYLFFFRPQNRKAWPWTGGGMFLYRQLRLRFEQRYSERSERIVCACDKVTKTVESGSSTEDERAPTSFEGLRVRSCPYHHSVACRWGPTSLKQARGSLVCPEFLEAGGNNEPLGWYYKRVTWWSIHVVQVFATNKF